MRARTAPRMNDDASSSSQLPGGSPDGRPTAAERAEALSVIRQMKEAEPPILSRRGAPPKPNVVACAIALYRGEVFESDADALRIFGAAETTMVRRDWVEDKLARFAPAGFNTPGEPLPTNQAIGRMHATARSPITPAATRPSTRIVLCGTNM